MEKQIKKIDYKNRLKKAFEAMLIIIDKPSRLKNIKRMIIAQLKNLDGVVNKDN